MPGNTTIVKGQRFWLPVSWGHANFAAGQTTAIHMAINGFPAGIDEFSLPRQLSLVSIGIELDAAVIDRFIRFQLTRDGTPVWDTFDMDSTTGKRRLIELPSGKLTGSRGNRLGIVWGSHPGLTPAGSIDGVVLLEMEQV